MSISVFTGDMVDAQGNVPTAQLVSFAVSYSIMGVCIAGSSIFGGIASERINLGLRKKLWRKVIYTKQSCYDADGGETLVSRVTTDCDFASQLVTSIVSFLSGSLSSVMMIGTMYALNGTIANYMMLLIPFSILVGWGYAKLRFLIAQKTQAMLSQSTTYLAERTSNLPLVKTSNAQELEIQQGHEKFQEQYKMQIKTGLMSAFYTALQTVYNIISILIPFTAGAGLVSAGVMSAGEVVAFYAISGSVGTFFTNVINMVGTIRQANGALARVINAMKLPDEQVDQGRTLDEPDADITFADVEFSYGEKPVLQRVSCQIPKHKVTAVIGSNGSGKSTIPSPTELRELARKSVVKDQLVLTSLPEDVRAELGDTLTLRTVSELPKFNKERVIVSIGRGLYDKGLETALAGKRVGESCEVTVKEKSVSATVLEIKRKTAPEPTDEMVEALQEKDYKGNILHTYAEYEAFICEGKTMEALANINYYIMEALLKDHPIAEYSEDDIRILGDLERKMFHQLFLDEKGIDLYQMSKEEMQEMWQCDSFDDFISMRHEWYKTKIHQCLICLNLLGLPCEGKTDPLDHYEVLSELTEMMYHKIKAELARRNEE